MSDVTPSTMESTGAEPWRFSPSRLWPSDTRPSPQPVLGWLGLGSGFLVLLYVCNVWPGAVPGGPAFFIFGGNSACMANEVPNLDFACDANGLPSGLRIPFGYPQVWLIGAVQWSTRLDLLNSYRFVWAATLLVALYGARRFFGALKVAPWIAWATAFLFLLAPIVSTQGGYGPLQLGFALVPAYCAVDRWFMASIDAGIRAQQLMAIIGVAVVRIFALFTDGYSLVMSLVVSGLMYLIWAVRRCRSGSGHLATVLGLAGALTTIAIAYVAYAAFIGASSFDSPADVDFFRGQGVDLFALATPTEQLWLFRSLGLHHTLSATEAYSDGHNLTDVYIGWTIVGVALLGAYAAWKGGWGRVVLLFGVLIVALALGLGPSLKIADFRSAQELSSPILGPDAYAMSSAEATAPTGLAWLYQHLPGVSTMRALYRWQLLVRLSLLGLAAVGATLLQARFRRSIAALAIALMAIESLPAVGAYRAAGQQSLNTVSRFTHDVIDPARDTVQPGERVLLLNPAPGGSGWNHYLANWICPLLHVRCYNAGGDKGLEIASRDQPPSVRNALGAGGDAASNVAALFDEQLVDAVILTHFDLMANAYSWPPAEDTRRASVAAASAITSDPRYMVVEEAWTTTVRVAPTN